jgi:DNA-binding transcriptional MocR family regulator
VLWLRCQSHVNTSTFFQEALAQGVSFAPGVICSPSGRYKNYMRVSFGVFWGSDIEMAIKVLGKLVYEHTSIQKTAQLMEKNESKK